MEPAIGQERKLRLTAAGAQHISADAPIERDRGQDADASMDAEAFNQSTTVSWFLYGILGIRPIATLTMRLPARGPVATRPESMRHRVGKRGRRRYRGHP